MKDQSYELPPLSNYFAGYSKRYASAVQAYARRAQQIAVEADRQRRGGPGLLVVQEADTIPHVHPEYGQGVFFTEDAILSPAPQPAEPVKVLSEEIDEAVKAYALAYSLTNTTVTELNIRLQEIRALLARYGAPAVSGDGK